MSKDYYKILGVSHNANKDEIKKAYRKLAHECHPDKNGGDDKKFKEVNEAYQILSNDAKRQQYDQFGDVFSSHGGQAGFGGQGTGGFSDWEDILRGFSAQGGPASGRYGTRINLEDLFSDVFGDFFTMGGFARRRPRRKNIMVNMEINLEDLIRGVEKEIRFEDASIRLKIKTKTSKEVLKGIKKILKKAKKEKK